jgi:hypothetical protein
VDRLDTWLNSRVGWHRALLAWVYTWPMGITVCFVYWAFIASDGPRPGWVLLVMLALSLIAAIPFAGLLLAMQRWRPARYRNKPSISWRFYVGWLLMMTGFLVGSILNNTQSLSGNHRHRVAFLIPVILDLSGCVFMLHFVWRERRLAKGRASDHQHHAPTSQAR